MLTVNLGPLSMPIALMLVLAALLVAAAAGRLAGRAQNTGISHILIAPTEMICRAAA